MASAGVSEWGVRLGPVTRNNTAATRQQAEDGAKQMLLDAANSMLQTARQLEAELLKGVAVPTGCKDPELEQEEPEVTLASYQLPNGNWFTLATSNVFGFKVVCKKLAEDG